MPHMVPAAELAAVDVQLITLRVSWGKLADLVASIPTRHRLFAGHDAGHRIPHASRNTSVTAMAPT